MALLDAASLPRPFTLPEALAGVDLGAFAAELEGTLRRAGARTQAAPLSLTCRRGRLPGTTVASFVLESDRIARAMVSHVRVTPLYAGVSVVVHPRPELDMPLFVADVQVPPPGALGAYVDTLGPGVTAGPGDPGEAFARLRADLAAVVETARGVRRRPVPAWIAPLSGGAGARLKARPLAGDAVLRVVQRYLERYLAGLAAAPAAKDRAGNLAAARSVRDVVRAHGPAGAYLARAFDDAFASRFLGLLWRDDATS